MILRVRTIRIRATVRAALHPAEKPEEQLHVFKTMNMCDIYLMNFVNIQSQGKVLIYTQKFHIFLCIAM